MRAMTESAEPAEAAEPAEPAAVSAAPAAAGPDRGPDLSAPAPGDGIPAPGHSDPDASAPDDGDSGLPDPGATAPVGLDFGAVVRTFEAVSAVLPETPAWSYPLLSAAAGVEVVVKHENIQPTGAFKVRGGVALMASLDEEERRRGVVTASTGNHAQSLAWAGARSGAPVTVVVPVSAPARKVAAVRALGARVVVEGDTMCDSLAHAGRLAAAEGMRLVSPGDEPAIVLGHATAYLELFRRHRDLRTVYVPVGSGSGAAGACLVRDALAPRCRIVGVQSAAAPASHDAWRAGLPVSVPSRTRVAGLAVGASFALTQSILRRALDDFILVGDDDILDAVRLMSTHAHTLAEGAGATGLAGLMADSARSTRGGPCAVVCTGGNADDDELAALGSPSSRIRGAGRAVLAGSPARQPVDDPRQLVGPRVQGAVAAVEPQPTGAGGKQPGVAPLRRGADHPVTAGVDVCHVEAVREPVVDRGAENGPGLRDEPREDPFPIGA